jgi:hypothetical protein
MDNGEQPETGEEVKADEVRIQVLESHGNVINKSHDMGGSSEKQSKTQSSK